MTAPLRVAVEGVGEVVVPFTGNAEVELYELCLSDSVSELSIGADVQRSRKYDAWCYLSRSDTHLDLELRIEERETPEDAVREVMTIAEPLLSAEMKAKLRGEL